MEELVERLFDDAPRGLQVQRRSFQTKKVAGWAATIAVPTLITGYFGMNVPYPGFGEKQASLPPSPPLP